jgi:small conductance mechanosensitive channel
VAHRSTLFQLLLALFVISAAAPGGAEPPNAAEAPAAATQPAEHPLAVEAAEIVERAFQAARNRAELEEQAQKATGSQRHILDEQIWTSERETERLLVDLAENLARQREAGLDISEMRSFMNEWIGSAWPGLLERQERRLARREELRSLRDAAAGEERLALENDLTTEERRLRIQYEVLVDFIVGFGAVGVDVATPRAYLAETLPEFAEQRGAGTRVALRARREARARLEEDPNDAELKRKLKAEEERVDRNTEALSSIAASMEELGLETASYRQLLLESTGEITTDILDAEVALGLLETLRERTGEALSTEGPRWLLKGVVFLVILALFRGLAALARRLVSRSVNSSRARLSQLLKDTLVSWSSKTVMAVGFLVALSQLGVQIGPLLAGLGIAGFILGFALQDALSNFAAGGMILAYRPFDVGDVIEAGGVRGKVSHMSLVSTTFHTFDNQTLIVPNSKIWSDVIQNVTSQEIRRIDLEFGVSYDADVDHADAVFRDILAKNEKVLDQPEPIVEVHNLGDSSVDFAVRPWTRTEDYWPVYWSLTREVKKRLDQEGISIPFPQRDVHVRVATVSNREDETAGS